MRVAVFSAGQLSTLAVVRDVLQWTVTRAVQGIICAAGPCTSQHLARAKCAMKLSATVTPRWEGVVSRGEATHLP